jgi:hypothetical protein
MENKQENKKQQRPECAKKQEKSKNDPCKGSDCNDK